MCQLMHITEYTWNSFSLAINYTILNQYTNRLDHAWVTCLIIVTHKLCIDQPWVYWTTSCIDTVFTVSSSFTRYQYYKKGLEILHQAPPPICLPIIMSHTIHVTKFPTPCPSVLAYCKWLKTVGRNSLGMRLSACSVYCTHFELWFE